MKCQAWCGAILWAFVLLFLAGPAHAFTLLGKNWTFGPDPLDWPVIPVPEIATDPNSGTTVGVLPVLLFTDNNHEIRNILAPDINANTTLGAGGNFRWLSYPSSNTQWYVVAGASENIYRHVEGDYATGLDHSRWWSFEGHFLFEHDPTERFFGIGNNSSFSNQTNYTTKQVYAEAQFGINLTRRLQIELDEQPRYVRIGHGAFNLPFIGKLFPTVKGLAGGSDLLNRIFVTYDTRNSITVPTRGALLALFGGFADRAFMSSNSFTTFGGNARGYLPVGSRVVLAGNLYARYVPAGNETPFWEMSWMGGDGPGVASLQNIPTSNEQTWRGYGAGRFIDNNMVLADFEVRTRVYEMDLFGTHGILEVAPFVDFGQVFHEVTQDPIDLTRFHPAGGLAFRGIALPFVVGYVDFGYSADGLAIFSGINYPF